MKTGNRCPTDSTRARRCSVQSYLVESFGREKISPNRRSQTYRKRKRKRRGNHTNPLPRKHRERNQRENYCLQCEKVAYWAKYKQQLTKDVHITKEIGDSAATTDWTTLEDFQPTTHQTREFAPRNPKDRTTECEVQTAEMVASPPPTDQSEMAKDATTKHGIYTSEVNLSRTTILRPKAPTQGKAIIHQKPLPKGMVFITPKQKATGKKRYEIKPDFQRTMEQK